MFLSTWRTQNYSKQTALLPQDYQEKPVCWVLRLSLYFVATVKYYSNHKLIVMTDTVEWVQCGHLFRETRLIAHKSTYALGWWTVQQLFLICSSFLPLIVNCLVWLNAPTSKLKSSALIFLTVPRNQMLKLINPLESCPLLWSVFLSAFLFLTAKASLNISTASFWDKHIKICLGLCSKSVVSSELFLKS